MVDLKNRRNSSNSQVLHPARSFVSAQQYATPQQESSYKFPRHNTDAGAPPNAYGHNSNRVYSNHNQYDSTSYLGGMASFGGNTSASQRFQRQMIKNNPYNADSAGMGNSMARGSNYI